MNIDWDKLYLAYDWAKEWQILLAGLLVLVAAVIFAWASLRAAKIGAAKSDIKARSQLEWLAGSLASPESVRQTAGERAIPRWSLSGANSERQACCRISSR